MSFLLKFVLSLSAFCHIAFAADLHDKVSFEVNPTSKCKIDDDLKVAFFRAVEITDSHFEANITPDHMTVIEDCEFESMDDKTIGLGIKEGKRPSADILIHEYAHSILGKLLGNRIYDLREKYPQAANAYWSQVSSPNAANLKQTKEAFERQVWYSSGLDEFFADIVALTILERSEILYNEGGYTLRNYGAEPTKFEIDLQAKMRASGMFDPHLLTQPIWKKSLEIASRTFGSKEKKQIFLKALMAVIKQDIDGHLDYYYDHEMDVTAINTRILDALSKVDL